MVINVHAGHNPDGKTACGAIGLLRESTENRNVKNEVIRQLRGLGHTVYDCTVENGTSVSNVLTNIVGKCNAHKADLDVSIHFNIGAGDERGNGKTTGTEVYIYEEGSKAKDYAERVCRAIAGLGFENRGVKVRPSLYVLRKTKAPSMLIECCFLDDADDVQRYNAKAMAGAIVRGITGKEYREVEPLESSQEAESPFAETPVGEDRTVLYRVQVGAYTIKSNALEIAQKLKDAGFEAVIVNA